MKIDEFANRANALCQNIQNVLIGKNEQIQLCAAAFFAGGHVLLEDVPGTGKTVLAKAFARSVGCSFSRVQFTPDLLPSELTGINFYNPKTGDFEFRQGSLFANIVLADEINRATPRTQAGLLESMEEAQISVDGHTYKLEKPYFVIATQNPIETRGTFPLPEAQLDRFMLQISLGYPQFEQSINILKRFTGNKPLEEMQPVCTTEDVLQMQQAAAAVFVHDVIFDYIMRIAQATRENAAVSLGVSTRACLALVRLCQSFAAMNARSFVTPDDVKKLVPCTFAHRLIMRTGTGEKANELLRAILSSVPAPVEDWLPEQPV